MISIDSLYLESLRCLDLKMLTTDRQTGKPISLPPAAHVHGIIITHVGPQASSSHQSLTIIMPRLKPVIGRAQEKERKKFNEFSWQHC